MRAEESKIASIDVGSNSFLLLLCQANSKGITKVFKDEIEIVRLGQGLSSHRKFQPEALIRARSTLTRFKEMIEVFKPDLILAKATAAARVAENRNELLDIGNALGIPIEIIPGQLEARITYQGVFWGQRVDETEYNLLIDIGGGSTELIVGKGMNIEYSISLPFGAVSLTERFIKNHPVSDQDHAILIQEIQSSLKDALKSISRHPLKQVLAVAGTPTTLAQIILGGYEDSKINGFLLSAAAIKDQEQRMKSRSIEQRITELGLPKGRADILYAGAILLRLLVEAVSIKNDSLRNVTVSTRGIRHGIVAEYFLARDRTLK